MHGRDRRHVVAVDLGTGGPKVGLVSLAGRVAWHEHVAVPTRTAADGTSVQDADHWWEVVAGAVRRGVDAGAIPADDLVGVSCTGQWASTVPVDAVGRPVGDCLLWSDTRGGPHARRVVGGPVAGYDPRALLRWIRRSGGIPSTSGADPVGHMLFLEHEVPDVARAARWYLEPVDYLAMRFTGEARATAASMAGAWLTDNRVADPQGYDPVLVRAAGVPAGKLPPLRPSGSVVGTVRDDVAADLGLPRGLAVVAGTPDLHSACVGSGAVVRHRAHVAVSTTSWVSCPHPDKKTDVVRQMATVPGIVPGLRLVANNQESGGRTLEWFRDLFVDDPAATPPSFDDLTELAAGAPPGSNGVLVTPWLAGERSPVDNRSARAGVHNLGLGTSRADVARAVLEGVALNSRWLADGVERFTGVPLGPVRAIGGGATSSLWCSIYADVLGWPVEQVAEPVLANLRGAALIAGMALGAVRPDEVADLVPVDAVHRPDPGAADVYGPASQAFRAFYRAQRGTFARLQRGR